MATNPCLCGYHGSSFKQCRCSPLQIESYLGKISGPLLDRIAIHIAVRPVDINAWEIAVSAADDECVDARNSRAGAGDSSAAVRRDERCRLQRAHHRRDVRDALCDGARGGNIVRTSTEVVAGLRSCARAHRSRRAHDRGLGRKRTDRGATRRGGGGVSGEGFTLVTQSLSPRRSCRTVDVHGGEA